MDEFRNGECAVAAVKDIDGVTAVSYKHFVISTAFDV